MTAVEERIVAALRGHAARLELDDRELADRLAQVRRRTRRRRAQRPVWLGAGALAAAAAVTAALTLPGAVGPPPEPPSFADREVGVLTEPYLIGSGSLDDGAVGSVQAFPAPFTFRVPVAEPEWYYFTGDTFQLTLDTDGGTELIAPLQTYDPTRTWRGQTSLQPAPVDADGWSDWLERTGRVEITDREELEIGGLAATRLTVEVEALPQEYAGCGGARACLALQPVTAPELGPARPGDGGQAGIDASVTEVTVLDLDGRAVLAVTGGKPSRADRWRPLLREFVSSLRFA